MNPEQRAALVERAADAIHDVDRRAFPDYVRHIPARSVYLDRARAAIHAAGVCEEPDADAVKHLQEFADMFHFAWGLWAAQDGATPLETEHLKRAMDDVFWSDMILKWSEMVEEGIIANPGLEAQDREIEDVKNRPAWLEHTRASLAAMRQAKADIGGGGALRGHSADIVWT